MKTLISILILTSLFACVTINRTVVYASPEPEGVAPFSLDFTEEYIPEVDSWDIQPEFITDPDIARPITWMEVDSSSNITYPTDPTSCSHRVMLSTSMWCDNSPCNTCTCMSCGYSYKCN